MINLVDKLRDEINPIKDKDGESMERSLCKKDEASFKPSFRSVTMKNLSNISLIRLGKGIHLELTNTGNK